MYVRTAPLGYYPRRRYLGAVAGKPSEGALLKSAAPGLIGVGLSTGLATSGLLAASVAGPIGAAAALAVELAMNLNHPHGTCAPNAPDMASFLKCWSHPIPSEVIPIWTDMWGGSDGKGWLSCGGAANGVPPSGGCYTNPGGGGTCVNGILVHKATGLPATTGCPASGCNCAPNGTIASVKGGGFQMNPLGIVSSAASSLTGGSSVAGIPTWVFLAGGAALLLFFMMGRN